LLWFIYDTFGAGNYETVTSTVDDREYVVQSLPDKQAAANLLANIRARMETLSKHLQKMYADDPRTERIVMKFNPDKISEGSNHSEHTSFSINKGEKIVFCLRSKDDKNKLVDLNTMMFVALHELAHVCTESVGHEPEFWDNFRWLLHEAINIGVYKEQDFKSKPVPYCGINITESPLNT
jgi:predicted metal-dependent hydrolase